MFVWKNNSLDPMGKQKTSIYCRKSWGIHYREKVQSGIVISSCGLFPPPHVGMSRPFDVVVQQKRNKTRRLIIAPLSLSVPEHFLFFFWPNCDWQQWHAVARAQRNSDHSKKDVVDGRSPSQKRGKGRCFVF
jgi:hypothetical protein